MVKKKEKEGRKNTSRLTFDLVLKLSPQQFFSNVQFYQIRDHFENEDATSGHKFLFDFYLNLQRVRPPFGHYRGRSVSF